MLLRFVGVPEGKIKTIERFLPVALAEIRKLKRSDARLPGLVRAMTQKEIDQGRKIRGPGHEGGAGHGFYDGVTAAINASMSPDNILMNVIHELLHAALPGVGEVEIDRLTDVIFTKAKLAESLTRSPLLIQELMTSKEERRLKSAIATGREGRASRIMKSVRRRESAEHKVARKRFQKARSADQPLLKRGKALAAPGKKKRFERRQELHRAERKVHKGIEKLRAQRKSERQASQTVTRSMRQAAKARQARMATRGKTPFGGPIRRTRPGTIAASYTGILQPVTEAKLSDVLTTVPKNDRAAVKELMLFFKDSAKRDSRPPHVWDYSDVARETGLSTRETQRLVRKYEKLMRRALAGGGAKGMGRLKFVHYKGGYDPTKAGYLMKRDTRKTSQFAFESFLVIRRTPLLIEMGPSPIRRPDLIGKTIAGGQPVKGATTTANVGLRSRPSGFAVYPETTSKKCPQGARKKGQCPDNPMELRPQRGIAILKRTKLKGA